MHLANTIAHDARSKPAHHIGVWQPPRAQRHSRQATPPASAHQRPHSFTPWQARRSAEHQRAGPTRRDSPMDFPPQLHTIHRRAPPPTPHGFYAQPHPAPIRRNFPPACNEPPQRPRQLTSPRASAPGTPCPQNKPAPHKPTAGRNPARDYDNAAPPPDPASRPPSAGRRAFAPTVLMARSRLRAAAGSQSASAR